MPGQEKTAWFCQKISQLKNSMYVTAIGILRNKEDAEDAIQNALMQGYDHLDDLRFFDKIKPWILRILVNECYKILKKRMYTVDIEELEVSSGEDMFFCSSPANRQIFLSISIMPRHRPLRRCGRSTSPDTVCSGPKALCVSRCRLPGRPG